jgi:hypothetical protein
MIREIIQTIQRIFPHLYVLFSRQIVLSEGGERLLSIDLSNKEPSF